MNTTTTSGARQLARLKNVSVAGSLFCNDRNSNARKTVAPTIQRTMCIGGLCHREGKAGFHKEAPKQNTNSLGVFCSL